VSDPPGTTGPPHRPVRCSVAARGRGDDLVATAPPSRRFLLLEVPGAWPADILAATGLPPDVARTVGIRANEVQARLLLIRRPGRHPSEPGRPRRWALISPGEGNHWGEWQRPEDLLDIDLTAVAHGPGVGAAEPERPIALICTHGRHDECCAVEGRPVLAVAGADPRFDVWECSHLSGDRFAANLLLLPSGLLFGGLDRRTAATVLDAAAEGRVVLDHFRGRCGEPPVRQAARWHLMQALGEDRPGRVSVESADEAGTATEVVARHDGHRYRLVLGPTWSTPHRLTCRARAEGRARAYSLVEGPTRLP
jgi:hypothetical protein